MVISLVISPFLSHPPWFGKSRWSRTQEQERDGEERVNMRESGVGLLVGLGRGGWTSVLTCGVGMDSKLTTYKSMQVWVLTNWLSFMRGLLASVMHCLDLLDLV